ncbi:unnamed protein product [Prunus armeniaca]|uniref:Tr-type G domain-containing protein n=1 Tax=Prunus armeniaca TaxID=36596 RepID=A0A6J5XC63_PRUAR|nr:unnamed protein product [Prunus armeniaca]
MAWRELGKKASFHLPVSHPPLAPFLFGFIAALGIRASLTTDLTSRLRRHGFTSVSTVDDIIKSMSAAVRCTPDPLFVSRRFDFNEALTKESLIRCYHASPELFARKGNDESFGLKTPKKEKFVKRDSKAQPPVEAPYVPPKSQRTTKPISDKTIEIFEGMTVVELAKRTGESISTLQGILTNVGEKVGTEFDPLSMDVAELIAMEVGINIKRLHSNEDALRQTSVAAKEAGGITQHLGAFVVGMTSGASITFLDTPGHAAFSAMRARGAAVTDIVVLVVAADDGVMPQTLEAMTHAKAANVPIVVAINKCDKPAANPERIRIQLASEGLMLEDMGGDVQVVEVSAMKKTGLDNLEEALLLQAEIMDLKARIDGPAHAYVVEARLDKGKGPSVTAIVKGGTLLCGQYVVVGSEWGRIRAIRDMAGKLVEKARPAMPIEIEGLKGLPRAGDDIVVVESEERARMLSAGRKKKFEKDRLIKIVEERASEEQDKKLSVGSKKKFEKDRHMKIIDERAEAQQPEASEEEPKRVEVPIIVKADVQGTVQAVTDALLNLNSPQVFVNVVHVGVGPISQSDLDMAEACGACIIGFNIKTPPSSVSLAAARASVKIMLHRVIYHLLEDIGNFIVDKAPGTPETKVAGEAEVLSIFELKGRSKSKGPDVKIAGCRVIDGFVTKSGILRLLRSGEVVFEGSCESLKREKQDVDTVKKGNECGLVIQNYDDFRVGDMVQCLEQVIRKPKFVSSESGTARIEC